jgi:hypothetical protein
MAHFRVERAFFGKIYVIGMDYQSGNWRGAGAGASCLLQLHGKSKVWINNLIIILPKIYPQMNSAAFYYTALLSPSSLSPNKQIQIIYVLWGDDCSWRSALRHSICELIPKKTTKEGRECRRFLY